jgi:hypothetical protein
LVVDALILYIPAKAMAPKAAQRAHIKLKAAKNLRATGKLRNGFIKFSRQKNTNYRTEQIGYPKNGVNVLNPLTVNEQPHQLLFALSEIGIEEATHRRLVRLKLSRFWPQSRFATKPEKCMKCRIAPGEQWAYTQAKTDARLGAEEAGLPCVRRNSGTAISLRRRNL